MTTIEARQYLDGFINYENASLLHHDLPFFKLERVSRFFSLLGDPQNNFKSLHIAGTKGKGSVCAFAAYILQAAGYRVGLYTSPHLNDAKERIRVLGPINKNESREDVFSGMISDEEFCRLLEEAKPKIEEIKKDEKLLGKLTYFEVYTGLALCHFKSQSIDFAVLETGLGGRLDATNAVSALVSAVTPVSLEHTGILGPTLTDIAKEKAAIIKEKKQTVIVAPQPDEAMTVIKERCRSVGCRTFFLGKDITFETKRQSAGGQELSVRGMSRVYASLKTKLIGEHQAMNAAVAIGMIEALKDFGFVVSGEAVCEGVFRADWPGRFETVGKNPLIILDSAHNPGSAKVLAQTVRDVFQNKKVTLVLGVSKDKDRDNICRELNGIAARVVFTKANNLRAHEFTEAFGAEFFPGKKCSFTENTQSALKIALDTASGKDIILIAGSIYLVGEARELCKARI